MSLEILLALDVREHISPFQINLFNDCPSRYYETYKEHTRFISLTKTAPTEFGDVIHKVTEKASLLSLENEDKSKNGRVYLCFSYSEIVSIFEDMLADFPKLCSSYYLERGKKQLLYWFNNEASREAKVEYININGTPVPGVEVGFERFLPNGILVKGFIDRVESNKYTKQNELMIVDWKTGYLAEDYSYNMMLYVIACSGFDKTKTYIPCIFQLENEYYKKYNFDKEEYESFYEFIVLVKESINRFADRVNELAKISNEALEEYLNDSAKINKWCYTCTRSNRCVKYISNIILGIPGISEDSRDPLTIVSYKEHLDITKKSIEKELDKIDAILLDEVLKHKKSLDKKEKITEEDLKLYIDDKRYLYIDRSKRRSADLSVVVPILIKNELVSKLSITLGELDKIIPKLSGEDQDAIVKAISYNYSDREQVKIDNGKKTK